MGSVEGLARAYERYVALPWESGLAGPQKVWFALYAPSDERRLRAHVGEFEIATKKAGHGWRLCDLSNAFGRWMADQEYRDTYFESPGDIEPYLGEFAGHVAGMVRALVEDADDGTVVAVIGVASLFGLARVSELVHDIAPAIRGRLLVLFPGERTANTYRLLDARDGWHYLAVAITAAQEE